MRPTSASLSWLKKLHLLVGMLAIAIKVAIPAGFMVAPQALAAGLTPIVLCTAQGDVTAFMNGDGQIVAHGEQGHAGDGQDLPGGHDGHPCTFAGQGTALTAPSAASVAVTFVVTRKVTSDLDLIVAPGLGLAAPPPPKTGPPLQA